MGTTRRDFLKIMGAGVVVAAIPIPALVKGVVVKPWPAGEPRMVFFRAVFQLPSMHPDATPGTQEMPTITQMVCQSVVSSQEEMDVLEQQPEFKSWVFSRESQLAAIAKHRPLGRLNERMGGHLVDAQFALPKGA